MIATQTETKGFSSSKNSAVGPDKFQQYIKKQLVSCGLSKIDPVWELIITSIISDAYNAGYSQGMKDCNEKKY